MSAYQPFRWTGREWAVIAEIDESEMKKDGSSLRFKLMIADAISVVVAGLTGWMAAARD